MGAQAGLPKIDEAACSLGRLAVSSCARCAEACPRAALTSEPEGLALDAAACSACGACVAACPQRAVTLEGRGAPIVAAGRGRDRGTAFLACPRVPGPAGGGPCLQALGLEALAALWLSGLRALVTLTADCATCRDGAGLDFADRVNALNGLLQDRGLPGLTWTAAGTTPRDLPRVVSEPAIDAGRRSLLGIFAPAARARAPSALARLQQMGAGGAARSAFSPRIDPARCTGCDACLRLCPEGALGLVRESAGGLAYRASASGCSGCRLCVELCPTDAMQVESQSPPQTDLSLTGFRCRGCGVEVHVPAEGPLAGGGLCAICMATGHHKRLHQVIA